MQNAKIKQQKQPINNKKLLIQIFAGSNSSKGSDPRQQRVGEYIPAK
ncbi:hypothetical protein L1077_24555 [Pseudoalteromonas luteoviolacea]|nr:hypothetical protein [Pseudoalteromonas luteoviolacea]MCF6442597.1 hypothetical protein [Pseudoalteromonas luteoviolacea]